MHTAIPKAWRGLAKPGKTRWFVWNQYSKDNTLKREKREPEILPVELYFFSFWVELCGEKCEPNTKEHHLTLTGLKNHHVIHHRTLECSIKLEFRSIDPLPINRPDNPVGMHQKFSDHWDLDDFSSPGQSPSHQQWKKYLKIMKIDAIQNFQLTFNFQSSRQFCLNTMGGAGVTRGEHCQSGTSNLKDPYPNQTNQIDAKNMARLTPGKLAANKRERTLQKNINQYSTSLVDVPSSHVPRSSLGWLGVRVSVSSSHDAGSTPAPSDSRYWSTR